MRNMTPEKAATEIRRAYGFGNRIEWMTITRITEMADLTLDEITAGVRYLMANDRGFEIAADPNPRVVTAERRANSIWIGGEYCDLVTWS